jgi:hypothetical protein
VSKFRKNIIPILLSAVLLTTGNFALAISHADCFSDESGHHKCGMECCKEGDCCTEEQGTVKITDENGSCCETHVEQSAEQDNALLNVNGKNENIKQSFQFFSLYSLVSYSSGDFSVITHKFKTTNIPVAVSNLRI